MSQNFQQSIDATRPHTLLTPSTQFSGSLEYRYDDTGEVVSVPNIWYNQPFQARVGWIRYQAQLAEDAATQLKRFGAYKASPQAINILIQKHTSRAEGIRAEANRIESQGSPTHPVAASHLELKFPDVIGMY